MKHRWVFLISFLQVALISTAVAQQAPFDTVIRGGRLLDGTGAPWIRADVAIRGDRIAAIGRLDGVPARHIIDARNRIVTPGFIDMHSHSDFTLLVDGHAQSKIRQGVTTEVIGETESAGPVLGAAVEVRKNALAENRSAFSLIGKTSQDISRAWSIQAREISCEVLPIKLKARGDVAEAAFPYFHCPRLTAGPADSVSTDHLGRDHPGRILLWAWPSTSNVKSEWLCMSMNPGVTIRFRASMMWRAGTHRVGRWRQFCPSNGNVGTDPGSARPRPKDALPDYRCQMELAAPRRWIWRATCKKEIRKTHRCFIISS